FRDFAGVGKEMVGSHYSTRCLVDIYRHCRALPSEYCGNHGCHFLHFDVYPQAVRIYRARGTDGIYGYSFLSAVMLIVSSLFWIAYAVSLNDIWVAISSPLTIVSGAAIIWVNYPPLTLLR